MKGAFELMSYCLGLGSFIMAIRSNKFYSHCIYANSQSLWKWSYVEGLSSRDGQTPYPTHLSDLSGHGKFQLITKFEMVGTNKIRSDWVKCWGFWHGDQANPTLLDQLTTHAMVVGSSLRLLKYFLIGLVSGLTRNLSPTNLSDLPYEGFFQTAFKKK